MSASQINSSPSPDHDLRIGTSIASGPTASEIEMPADLALRSAASYLGRACVLVSHEDDGEPWLPRYKVDLGEALGNWRWDYLDGVPLTAHFDDFEGARGYVLENLKIVIQNLSCLVKSLRAATSLYDLNVFCSDLICEDWGEDE